MTQTGKLANYDRLETHARILGIAACERPDFTYRHRIGRDVFTWSAYRLDDSAGGYVIGAFRGFTDRHAHIHLVGTLDQLVNQRPSTERNDGLAYALTAFVNARAKKARAAQIGEADWMADTKLSTQSL